MIGINYFCQNGKKTPTLNEVLQGIVDEETYEISSQFLNVNSNEEDFVKSRDEFELIRNYSSAWEDIFGQMGLNGIDRDAQISQE